MPEAHGFQEELTGSGTNVPKRILGNLAAKDFIYAAGTKPCFAEGSRLGKNTALSPQCLFVFFFRGLCFSCCRACPGITTESEQS